MTKLTLEQQELLFANDCKLINLRYEYHGYTGTEKWAIVTELAEEELWVKYPDVIRRYTPFILLSMAQGEVITEYQNYEARERMRRLLFGHAFDINDGEFEVHHPELAVDTDPIEGQVINRALKKLIQDNDLPDVVFHSFRHASITYKLKWNGGDMKSVQGDSGHARMDMVADVSSHIIDEDRRYNAQKFEEQFYNAKGLKNAEEGKTAPMPKFETSVELLDPMAEVQKGSEVEEEKPAENSADENAALLAKLLSNPDTAALLKALAKTI